MGDAVNAWAYRAALYCEACANRILATLEKPEVAGDSETYPQGPYSDGGGEADCPQHCDHCQTFLQNPLTGEGEIYVRGRVAEFDQHGTGAGDVIETWRAFYTHLFN